MVDGTLAGKIINRLEDQGLTRGLRQNARAYAERRPAMTNYLDQYCNVISRLTGENPAPIYAVESRPNR
jgi:hypothetical protein